MSEKDQWDYLGLKSYELTNKNFNNYAVTSNFIDLVLKKHFLN